MVPIEVANMILLHIPLQYRATSYYNWKMITPMLTSIYNLSVDDIVKNTSISSMLLFKQTDTTLFTSVHTSIQAIYSNINICKYIQYLNDNIYTLTLTSVHSLNIFKLLNSANIFTSTLFKMQGIELCKYYNVYTSNRYIQIIDSIYTFKLLHSISFCMFDHIKYDLYNCNNFDLVKYYHISYHPVQKLACTMGFMDINIQKFIYAMYLPLCESIFSTDTHIDTYKLMHMYNIVDLYQLHTDDVVVYKLLLSLDINIDFFKYDHDEIQKIIFSCNITNITRLHNTTVYIEHYKLLYMMNLLTGCARLYDIEYYKLLHYYNIDVNSTVFMHMANNNEYDICKVLYSINTPISIYDSIVRRMIARIEKNE